MNTSFPFLKIARDHSVPYGQIMREVSECELSLFLGNAVAIEYSLTLMSPLRDRQRAIYAAIANENMRRQAIYTEQYR